MTLRTFFYIGLALVVVTLVGCATVEERQVYVVFKEREDLLPLCTDTGAFLMFERWDDVPKFYLENADMVEKRGLSSVVLGFETSKCDYTQRHLKKVRPTAMMLQEEFAFKYDHDQAFRDSIQSYTFR